MGLTPHGRLLGDPSLSKAYTEALAHGQSYISDGPGPSSRLLDTSLYRGRQYLYFGIVPFVAFMLPWFFVTGSAPSPETAILFFCAVGYAGYGTILLLAARSSKKAIPAIFTGSAFLTVIVASGTWPLMGRPAIYEIENAAAYAFMSLALLSLFVAETTKPRRPIWLMAAAAAAALTMGCRPNYFPAVAVVTAWILYRSADTGKIGKSRVRRAALAIAPLILVGLTLAWWNYHRFDDPLDFGLKHTVSEDPTSIRPLTRLANLPYGLHRYTLGSALLSRYFPFIQGTKEGFVPLASGQEHSNQVYGFLIITPILLGSLLLTGRLRETALGGAGGYAAVLFGTFAGNFVFLSSVTQSCYRYPADFLGPLALLAAIGIISIPSIDSKAGRNWARWLLLPMLGWSGVALIVQVFSTAQTTELFDQKRPGDFSFAAWPFNHAVYIYESLTRDGPRAFGITVELPKDRYGHVEPLFVDGADGAQDFLYLLYSGPGQLRVGFESSGHGGPVSAYKNVDYDKPHSIEIRYGSFLPPDDHPLLKTFSAQDKALARTMITVLLDGAPVLDSWAYFHLPRGNFHIGESPFDMAFGPRFTGKIRNASRPLLPVRMSPGRWDRNEYGPITMTIVTVPMPTGVYDPLISLGDSQQGAELLIEHTGGTRLRTVWIDVRGRKLSGPEFGWPNGRPLKMTVTAGCLFPPIESSTWLPGEEFVKRRQLKGKLHVEADGIVLLDDDCPPMEIPPSEVTYGKDTIGLIGGVVPAFPGSFDSARRLPW